MSYIRFRVGVSKEEGTIPCGLYAHGPNQNFMQGN